MTMTRITLVAIVLAAAATASAQSSSAANPFTGIPPLTGLPVCNTECTPVGQAQSNWNGDYSALCTTSFATSLTTCLSCILNSSLGAVVDTPEAQQQLSQAITAYQNACQQSGSPVSINVSSILSPTASGSGSGAASSPTMTATQTASTSTPSTGAATQVGLGAGAMLGAVAFVAGNLW